MTRRTEDITGRKFNRLTVLAYAGNGYWLCQCDCGRETRTKAGKLRSNQVRSCGCWNRDRIAALNKQNRYCGLCDCGDHAFTILTRGYIGLVSPQDAHHFATKSWCAHQTVTGAWSVAGTYRAKLHRVVLSMQDQHAVVDHRNGNPFDNRRHNLRVCANASNVKNQRLRRDPGKSSRFKGVTRSKAGWIAQIQSDGHHQYLGTYQSERAAAEAYDRAAIRLHGEFARTNAALGLL